MPTIGRRAPSALYIMASADELTVLAEGVCLWHAYEAAVKAELFSTAFQADGQLFVVDPIHLASTPLEELSQAGPLGGVIVTNANHWRASDDFARRFNIQIFASRSSCAQGLGTCDDLSQLLDLVPGMQVMVIEGAAPGEVAVYYNRTLVMGDALIHLEPYGFTFLPAKYCSDPSLMKRSLRQLLSLRPERILFAHGDPIINRATARLTELIEGCSGK